MNAIFPSIFHKVLFIDLRRICQRTKVRNLVFITCSSLVGIYFDLTIQKLNESNLFLNEIHALLFSI